MTGGKLDTAGMAMLAPERREPFRPPLSMLERECAELSAKLARTQAAYNCLRSAAEILRGDPAMAQALDRARAIVEGR